MNHTSDTLEAKKIPFHNIMHTHKHIFTLKHAEKFIVAGITKGGCRSVQCFVLRQYEIDVKIFSVIHFYIRAQI